MYKIRKSVKTLKKMKNLKMKIITNFKSKPHQQIRQEHNYKVKRKSPLKKYLKVTNLIKLSNFKI